MNSKTIIGGIIAGLVSFLVGWLIYGILLRQYYADHSFQYAGLMKDPPVIWAIAIANLCWGFGTAFIFNIGSVNTVPRGVVIGGFLSGILTAGFDIMMYAQMNLFGLRMTAIDIVVSTVMGAIVGAVLGWWFGRK